VFGSGLECQQRRRDKCLADAAHPFRYRQIVQNAFAQLRFVSQLPKNVWWQNRANYVPWLLHDEILLSNWPRLALVAFSLFRPLLL
jgi:hypothetical protein